MIFGKDLCDIIPAMKKKIATGGPALSRRAFFGQATAATMLAAAGCLMWRANQRQLVIQGG